MQCCARAQIDLVLHLDARRRERAKLEFECFAKRRRETPGSELRGRPWRAAVALEQRALHVSDRHVVRKRLRDDRAVGQQARDRDVARRRVVAAHNNNKLVFFCLCLREAVLIRRRASVCRARITKKEKKRRQNKTSKHSQHAQTKEIARASRCENVVSYFQLKRQAIEFF